MSVFAGVLGHVRREIAVRRRPATETAPFDHVTLPDGSVVAVLRGNLTAAKALSAARAAAERRAAAGLTQPRGLARGFHCPPTPDELLAQWASEATWR